jgi:diguanylate cyclase (GGDEF)-like protein
MRTMNRKALPSAPSVLGGGPYAALAELADLVRRPLDPPTLYVAAVSVLERTLGDLLAFVVAAERGADDWRCVVPQHVPAGLQALYPQRLQLPATLHGFWRGAPQVVLDAKELQGSAALTRACRQHAIAATALVPIPVAGGVRAALVLRARSAEVFTAQVLAFLRCFATTIGMGIELHEQQQVVLQSVHERVAQRRALGLLDAITQLLAHAPSEALLLAETCRIACAVGDYAAAWIGLLDTAGRELQLVAHTGLGDEPALGSKLAVDDLAHVTDAALLAIASGRTQSQRVTLATPAGWPLTAQKYETGALLALPLCCEGTLAGVVVLISADPARFTESEVRVAARLVDELGLGLRQQRDCVARIVAEQASALHVRDLHAALSAPHVGVMVLSAQQTVNFASAAFCALFGLEAGPQELENLPLTAIHARLAATYAQPQQELQRIKEILAAGVAISGDEVNTCDGRVFLRDFTPIMLDGVVQGSLWQLRDVTLQKRHELRVEQLAFFDEASGLPNRRRLFELLEAAHATAWAQQSVLAVGVLDMDRFKIVNDTLGRDGGDRALVEASARIRGLLRPSDVLARFGGDEFALIIFGLDSKEQLDAISRVILQALRTPFDVAGGHVQLSASVGWTMFPVDGADAEGLIRHAELALYTAKEDGRDCGLLYDPTMEAEQLRLRAMRERVAHALQTSRLQLLFQPIVYIDGLPGRNGVAGMEALLRLDDTGLGLVEPAKFMHVLDDPQLARPIGRYVLGEALKQCHAWMLAGVSVPVAVNISTRHLLHPAFFGDIDSVLEAYPDVLDVGFGIEVTETGPAMDEARAKVVIEECRLRGIRVSLDDFGTGSASLSHLQKLDVEHIKLDQSFVHDILNDERNMAIAAGVITTARMLAKTVIAEGVETAEQAEVLASLGCHQLQGFSISRPMPSAAVPGWVTRWKPPSTWAHLVDERRTLLASQGDGSQGPA